MPADAGFFVPDARIYQLTNQPTNEPKKGKNMNQLNQRNIRGEVSLELAGRTITLTPSFANLSAVEATANRSIMEIARDLNAGGIRLKDMEAILCCASTPKMVPEDLSKIIEQEGMNKAIEGSAMFLVSAITAGQQVFADNKQEEQGKPKTTKRK